MDEEKLRKWEFRSGPYAMAKKHRGSTVGTRSSAANDPAWGFLFAFLPWRYRILTIDCCLEDASRHRRVDNLPSRISMEGRAGRIRLTKVSLVVPNVFISK